MAGMIDRAQDHSDRSRILVVFGALMLLAGGGLAFLAPLEMVVFYWFSEGGRFYYEGFGFGSFMFGNIAAQIIGYSLTAMVLMPLGYGHLKVRRWARTLFLSLLYFWLIVGIPLIVLVLLVLFTSKDLTVAGALFFVILLALSYLVAPWLLIRFYKGKDVRLTFETRDPNISWVEGLPQPALTLSLLFLLGIAVLFILVFFRGIFPFFGMWLFDLTGIILLDASMLWLACLIWGTLRLRAWAWWGGLVYLALMTTSAVLTFMRTSYLELLAQMRFAPTEMEALDGIPLQGYHLAILIGLPLLAIIGLLALSRRHFGEHANA